MWTIYEQIVEIQFFLCKVVKMKNYDVENINSFVAIYLFCVEISSKSLCLKFLR